MMVLTQTALAALFDLYSEKSRLFDRAVWHDEITAEIRERWQELKEKENRVLAEAEAVKDA